MAPLTEERANQILIEETVDGRPATRDMDDDERQFRRRIREDVQAMKDAGIEPVVPSLQPDAREPD